MKLDTTKITDNVAIHCPKKEYVRPLFEAMGLSEAEIEKAESHWEFREDKTCFKCAPRQFGWDYGIRAIFEEYGHTIIPFEDLIIPEESNLAKKHNDGCKYCKEEKSLIANSSLESSLRELYIAQDGSLTVAFFAGAEETDSDFVDIYYCPMCGRRLWTPEEQEMAKKDSFRFGYIVGASNIQRILYEAKPFLEDGIWQGRGGNIYTTDYPNVKEGECVRLEEIGGGGE